MSVSSRNPARPVEISKEQCRELREARDVLHKFLWVDVHGVLRRWHLKLVKECVEKNDEETLDRNTRHLCNIMAHMLLCVRNARAQELDSTKVALVVRGIVFLSTRHQWNHDLLVESGDNGTRQRDVGRLAHPRDGDLRDGAGAAPQAGGLASRGAAVGAQ